MTVIDFFGSPLGRVARLAVGFALIAYGSTLASLMGLVLMMVGMVPAVTGLVDMCLIGGGDSHV
ncbi:MAG: YgaP-like transmembrane domain [Vicinamibacterales bacterium]